MTPVAPEGGGGGEQEEDKRIDSIYPPDNLSDLKEMAILKRGRSRCIGAVRTKGTVALKNGSEGPPEPATPSPINIHMGRFQRRLICVRTNWNILNSIAQGRRI